LKTDIFEDMVELADCNHISDLPYRKKRVLEELKELPPQSYPKEQLEKFCHYVFGVDYTEIMGTQKSKTGESTFLQQAVCSAIGKGGDVT
jgi:hypothetical protein